MIEPPHSMRDAAVALARNGFRVFKLKVNLKTPSVPKYFDIATNDPQKVAEMWTAPVTGDSLHNNIGILTGGDFMVVDVDVKDGKQGLDTLDKLIDIRGFSTDTITARSPTGSLHYFLSLPEGRDTRNTVEKVGPGVDTRGHHGYVVGAGSITKDGLYEWLVAPGGDTEMAQAPDWLLDLVEARKVASSDRTDRYVTPDDESAIRRATEYLKTSAPEATLRAGSNTVTYGIAARCKDFGVSQQTAFELMLEHWNEDKSNPPWPPEKLERVVENAYRYGQEAIGRSSAHADFSSVSYEALMASAQPKAQSRLFMRTFGEARARALHTAANPLIKHFLDTAAFSVIYGESGAGKTFVALDIAYHIAAGVPWNGRKTTQGPVLYIAAEAGEDINARIEALGRHYSPSAEPTLHVVPCLVDLFNPNADLKALLELIRGAEAVGGFKYAMIVVDTLARVMGTGDENSTQDMNVMVRNFDRLRVATSAHIMVVHHSGKNKAAGARGSSALRAATDTEIEVVDGMVVAKKQRSRGIGGPIKFTLKGIEIGMDADGDRISSCVVILRTASEFEQVDLTPAEEEIYEIMEAYCADKAKVDNCRSQDIPFAYEDFCRIISSEGVSHLVIPKGTWRSRSANVCEKGWIKKGKRGQWFMV